MQIENRHCHRFPSDLSARIRRAGVIAVLVVDSADDAIPLAETLLANGIDAIELTLRTPQALGAIERLADEFAELVIGAGTVLTIDQVREAKSAGAQFAVAPGLNPETLRAASQFQLPFAPGVCTPSEIEIAVSLNCQLLKFFPAEPSGGISYLHAIAGPYAHLDLQFIPLGGINSDNVSDYARSSSVHSIGGSWIAPRQWIQQHRWVEIGKRAKTMARLVEAARNPSS
ncbi:bifunctional 4-hydroxy-2-oxoglutarate aldolase/2-dehydro-3-deoxy-phosphogluconate aldolase [Roseiconus lacunae]|uniref:2-dehydro-3-deoxy-phosphogluconate aldolase n=1 Tax=Roseiconus lacunae TaxID=2605694 RepID=A0ABT7PQK8_9BACT|nr:bifunctional 4-hydroxy-2-oxoglutarate aldolase/2-dehydro-3-deoxy-phosphogluconate aldolase [Roseiconus lacunae]MDM4018782.1 bifunctional 4-hydroxy-2-oxoglutarate aldolase/2-dehydro-3-deoxy-phosphogluconate aldolase [Roseiconus lacunae]